MENYRHNEATGDVHEWSEKAKAYVFIGNTNGRTLDEFIDAHEQKSIEYFTESSFDNW